MLSPAAQTVRSIRNTHQTLLNLQKATEPKGIRVTNREEIAEAFEEAKKNTKRPTIIEFIIDPEEMVYPMIKPGGTLADMIMDC